MAEWRIYGCGSASSDQYMQSSYEFVDGDTRLQVDFGNGALRQRCIAEGSIEAALDSVDRIIMTHAHPDHTVDLTRHVVAWMYSPGYSPGKPVHLYGTLPTLDGVFRLLDSVGFAYLFDEVYVTHELKEGVSETIGDIEVTPFYTQHTDGSIGLRFVTTGGVTVGFTSDTSPFDGLASSLQNLDLLISECSFFELEHPMHLNLPQVGSLAALTKPKALMIVHAYPELERLPEKTVQAAMAKHHECDFFIGRDGMVLGWNAESAKWIVGDMF